MDLREYLFRNRMTVKAFSEKIGCSRNHVSEIIHARRIPGRRLAKDIEQATNGEVTAESLLNEKKK